MKSDAVVNGSFAPRPTRQERHAVAEGMALTVHPGGATALFRRTGVKHPGGRRVVMLVGEIDGVRAFLSRRGGTTHVVLTRANLEP